jgi:hypothetical protein
VTPTSKAGSTSVSRVLRLFAVAVSLLVVGAAGGVHAQPLDDVPAGCPPRPEVAAVFVGEVRQRDVRAARFEVIDIRAGSLDGAMVDRLVDVDYFADVRFLDDGGRYLVGAAPDPLTGRLVSKVRAPELRFGGNQVVALDQLNCPTFKDPAITLHVDGSTVESGVLTPLLDQSGKVLLALVTPAVWAFGFLAVLAALKLLIVASLRRVARPSR